MENTPITRKWSEIQGLAIVAVNTGKKVGTVDNFYFDPSNNTIQGFVIRSGFFGHRAILSKDINSIGIDAITFTDESILTKESHEDELKTAPLGSSLLSYRILSESGTVIGTIGNLLLDISAPTAARIAAIELTGGLREHVSGHYPVFSADQIVRYGQDVIIIPDTVAQSLQES